MHKDEVPSSGITEFVLSDKVYKCFAKSVDAERFLSGMITLRSSDFYEALEYAGDNKTGDANERTHSGFNPASGGSTWRSFVPKYLLCCTYKNDWRDGSYWIEIDSQHLLYQRLHTAMVEKFPSSSLMLAQLRACKVQYLNAEEIQELNLQRHASPSDERLKNLEVKRKHYEYQSEWRVIFEGAGRNAELLGEMMSIELDSVLGRWLAQERPRIEQNGITSYQEFLSRFREIQLDLGSLHDIARMC